MSILVVSCIETRPSGLHKESRFLMGTLVTVILHGDRQDVVAHSAAVFKELNRIEDLTSFHKTSMLNSINDASGVTPVQVTEELIGIIGIGLALAEKTHGAFDPTIGAVTRLWNFSGASQSRVPEAWEIRDALPLVNRHLVQIDHEARTVFLPRKGMALDLGGMVKAYSLERAGEILSSRAVQSALVDIGGDILALGEKSSGQSWRIGIRDPRSQGSIKGIVSLKDQFVLTSGDYERYLASDGRRYHHILDPQTGYPAEGVQSVTLVATKPLTTVPAGIFVMGLKKGLDFINAMPDVYGWIIDSAGIVHSSQAAGVRLEGASGR